MVKAITAKIPNCINAEKEVNLQPPAMPRHSKIAAGTPKKRRETISEEDWKNIGYSTLVGYNFARQATAVKEKINAVAIYLFRESF